MEFLKKMIKDAEEENYNIFIEKLKNKEHIGFEIISKLRKIDENLYFYETSYNNCLIKVYLTYTPFLNLEIAIEYKKYFNFFVNTYVDLENHKMNNIDDLTLYIFEFIEDCYEKISLEGS